MKEKDRERGRESSETLRFAKGKNGRLL
jgi:hypothetical protein